MEFKDFENVHAMVRETADKKSFEKAFSWFGEDGNMESVTWSDFCSQVDNVSKGLIALGLKKGDRVGILGHSSYQWVLAELGIVSIGACSVGLFGTNLQKDCRHIIDHSESSLIFVEDEFQLDKLQQISKKIPSVKKIVLMRGENPGDNSVLTFEEFLEQGKNITDAALKKIINGVKYDDPAMIVYTSGTTGLPKGVILTHKNINFSVQSITAAIQPGTSTEQFHFLALAHIYGRCSLYFALFNGHHVTFGRGMKTLLEDLKIARPHYFSGLPGLFEKMYNSIISNIEKRGGLSLWIFNRALDTGYRVSSCKTGGEEISLPLRIQYGIASFLVFKKIQEAFGGRLDYCISAGASLEVSITEFFHAVGIQILEGMGMTENMSFSHVNRRDKYRFGWVGTPGPGIESRIVPGGELQVRGDNVMKGYYKMPKETKKSLTSDGWLHTGDVGEMDDEGFLRITGRMKDLILSSGGKSIAPAAIEGLMVLSKYINQFCVIGDRRNFLSGVVTLDRKSVEEFARSEKIECDSFGELFTCDQIKSLIEGEVEEKNRYLASFETIKKIIIVPEFTIENDLLTPTLNVKRFRVAEVYREQIDLLYREAGDEETGTSFRPLVERRLKPERRKPQAHFRTIASHERRKEKRREAIRW